MPRLGLGLHTTSLLRGASIAALLFGAGERGLLLTFEPGTVYQDSAGTAEATWGQQVGLAKDTSGRGNHLIQSTNTSRPVYGREPEGGVRNRLTHTEAFDNAAWGVVNGGTVSAPIKTPDHATAPDGTQTACRLQITTTGGTTGADYGLLRQTPSGLAAGATLTSGVWLKSNTAGSQKVTLRYNAAEAGVVTVTTAWQEFAVTDSNGTPSFDVGIRGDTTANASLDVLVWHPQFETGSAATAYQRVGSTGYDVTEAGKRTLYYLEGNGTSQFMQTAAPLDLSGTDKVTVWAGAMGVSGGRMLVELGQGDANGSFHIFRDTARWSFQSRGTLASNAVTTSGTFNNREVLTGSGDISSDAASIRFNGATEGTSAVDQGTGNQGSHVLYFMVRGSTTPSLFFNGKCYGLIVRGAASSAALIDRVERDMMLRTGVAA